MYRYIYIIHDKIDLLHHAYYIYYNCDKLILSIYFGFNIFLEFHRFIHNSYFTKYLDKKLKTITYVAMYLYLILIS